MANTATWDSPDTVQTKQGQTTPGVVYVIDPVSGKASQGSNSDNLALIASSAYTSNQTSGDQTNSNGKGLLLFIKTGAFGSGASGIVATIQGKDPVSGQVYTILASAALTASSFTVLRVYPNLTTAANLVANDILPRTWNVTLTATAWGTGGSTVGVAACVVV
jgi:hypothetical protein